MILGYDRNDAHKLYWHDDYIEWFRFSLVMFMFIEIWMFMFMLKW